MYDEMAKNNVKKDIKTICKTAIVVRQTLGDDDGFLTDRLEEIVVGMVKHYGLEETVVSDYKGYIQTAMEMKLTALEKAKYQEVSNAREMIYAYCDTLENPKQIMQYVRTAQEMIDVWQFETE